MGVRGIARGTSAERRPREGVKARDTLSPSRPSCFSLTHHKSETEPSKTGKGKDRNTVGRNQRFLWSPFFAEQLLKSTTCLKTQFGTRTVKALNTQTLQQPGSHPVVKHVTFCSRRVHEFHRDPGKSRDCPPKKLGVRLLKSLKTNNHNCV